MINLQDFLKILDSLKKTPREISRWSGLFVLSYIVAYLLFPGILPFGLEILFSFGVFGAVFGAGFQRPNTYSDRRELMQDLQDLDDLENRGLISPSEKRDISRQLISKYYREKINRQARLSFNNENEEQYLPPHNTISNENEEQYLPPHDTIDNEDEEQDSPPNDSL